ncbi:hypothetical protein [Microbacterium sp. NPDC076911]|uniref:hypothetical protein n=1 Tax=Microbacterium sp. NPDC076911 TaxID=3154958 RepID=UPI00343A57C9
MGEGANVEGLDADERAELDELRARAYGPAGAAPLDEQAIARLRSLDAKTRPPADPVSQPEERVVEAASDAERAHTPRPPTAAVTAKTVAGRGRRTQNLRGLWVALTVVAAVLLVGLWLDRAEPDEPTTTPASATPRNTPHVTAAQLRVMADPYSETLLKLRLDGSFGNYIDLPSGRDTPEFPAESVLQWFSPLGEYYGWDLWIAGSGPDGEHCILIQRSGDVRSRCVPVIDQPHGELRVSLAGIDIDADEQPRAMADDQRVRFWWRENGVVEVLLGSFLPP